MQPKLQNSGGEYGMRLIYRADGMPVGTFCCGYMGQTSAGTDNKLYFWKLKPLSINSWKSL